MIALLGAGLLFFVVQLINRVDAMADRMPKLEALVATVERLEDCMGHLNVAVAKMQGFISGKYSVKAGITIAAGYSWATADYVRLDVEKTDRA